MMITFLIIFASILTIIGLVGSIALWLAHISMTKQFTSQYGYASLEEFTYQFNKVSDWQFKGYGKDAIESYSNKEGTYIMHDILSFEGDGMILNNPLSYLFAIIILKRKMKELDYRSKLIPLRWRIMGRSK